MVTSNREVSNYLDRYRLDINILKRYERRLRRGELNSTITAKKEAAEAEMLEIEQTIAAVPNPASREILELYYIDLLSYEEIAERLEIKEKTAAGRRAHALKYVTLPNREEG